MEKVFKIVGLVLLILCAVAINAQTRDSINQRSRIIQGKVIEDLSLEPYSGVMIFADDTIKSGETDLEGCFRIEIPMTVNKLTFRYVGTEDAILDLSEDCNEIELIMVTEAHYCFHTLRKINKLRRKEYDKLSKLHQQAYDMGIFKSPKACYTREFHEFSWGKKENKERVYNVINCEMPKFPGGQDSLLAFLNRNVIYPKECQEEGIQGRVEASFLVNGDGTLDSIRISKSVHPLMDAEVIRVIKAMPKWEWNPKYKPYEMKVPVDFRLEASKKEN